MYFNLNPSQFILYLVSCGRNCWLFSILLFFLLVLDLFPFWVLSRTHGYPVGDYISQPPLQLDVTMWPRSSQWDMSKCGMCNFYVNSFPWMWYWQEHLSEWWSNKIERIWVLGSFCGAELPHQPWTAHLWTITRRWNKLLFHCFLRGCYFCHSSLACSS